VIVAVAVFSPVLYWNREHDWISFKFQSVERYSSEPSSNSWTWPLVFLGAQVMLATPVVAWLLGPALAWAWRTCRKSDENLRYLLAFGVPMPLFLTFNAFTVQPKVHWALPAFVPLVMILFLWWRRTEQRLVRPWAKRAGVVSIAIVWLGCLASPAIELLPQRGGANWSGCDEIAAHAAKWSDTVAAQDPAAKGVFFFADNHRDSAQLYRSLLRLPQPPAKGVLTLASETVGRRGRQFDIWSKPKELVGWDAVFVQYEPEGRENKIERARRFFDDVQPVDRFSISKLGIEVREVQIFVCRGYRGPTGSP
jgi:undecaprenyl-diphosphatase